MKVQSFNLSAEDQRAFAEAILNPPEPTPALRRAFQRCRELIKDSSVTTGFDTEPLGVHDRSAVLRHD